MKIQKIRDVKTPTRGTSKSAGIDFYVPNNPIYKNLSIAPGESVLIPSGIKAEVPKGYALIAFNKSGIAMQKRLYVGACVVDEDYQGEIHIHLTNVGDVITTIHINDKIAQFILLPVFYDTIEEVEYIHSIPTERGTGAFGSTNHI